MSDKHKEMLALAAEAVGVAGELPGFDGNVPESGGADLRRLLEALEAQGRNWPLEERERSGRLLAELEARLADAVRNSVKNGSI